MSHAPNQPPPSATRSIQSPTETSDSPAGSLTAYPGRTGPAQLLLIQDPGSSLWLAFLQQAQFTLSRGLRREVEVWSLRNERLHSISEAIELSQELSHAYRRALQPLDCRWYPCDALARGSGRSPGDTAVGSFNGLGESKTRHEIVSAPMDPIGAAHS